VRTVLGICSTAALGSTATGMCPSIPSRAICTASMSSGVQSMLRVKLPERLHLRRDFAMPMQPMFLRKSTIQPCLPRPAREPPAGPGWIHEIKHDGFRILARRDERGVRLFTRNGYNFAGRFPKIVAAVESLPVRSCVIDGEAIVVDERGLSVFDLIRYRQHDGAAVLSAFDLIALDGKDLRKTPLEERKQALAKVLSSERDGIAFIPSDEPIPRLRGPSTDRDPCHSDEPRLTANRV